MCWQGSAVGMCVSLKESRHIEHWMAVLSFEDHGGGEDEDVLVVFVGVVVVSLSWMFALLESWWVLDVASTMIADKDGKGKLNKQQGSKNKRYVIVGSKKEKSNRAPSKKIYHNYISKKTNNIHIHRQLQQRKQRQAAAAAANAVPAFQ